MDEIRLTLNRMQQRMDDFDGALQDLQVEQRALTKQSERVEETVTRLARSFELFKIAINDVFEGLVQHDTDELRWRNAVEDRLSEIERRLAG
ncbi:MAG: hypothetical protein HY319_03010 [Armatimonadetes bacterium]|nr:hypothetical protein [Armatimonadota bacterium]